MSVLFMVLLFLPGFLVMSGFITQHFVGKTLAIRLGVTGVLLSIFLSIYAAYLLVGVALR